MSLNTTWTQTRLTPLDGLRGYAVLIVLLCHAWQQPLSGHLGVDVFFTLSGFLISSQLFAHLSRADNRWMQAFYLKRCLRLLPAFFAACALYGLIVYCFPQSAPPAKPLKLLGLIFMSDIYWARHEGGVAFMNHTWTLSVEWQFYLAWPLVLGSLSWMKVGRKGMLGFMAAAVAVVWWARWRGDHYLHFDGILIGSSLPLWRDAPWLQRLLAKRGIVLVSLVTVLLALAVLMGLPAYVWPECSKVAVSGLTAMLIVLLGSGRNRLSVALFENAPARYFGRISYALYLYHFPIAALMYVNGFQPLQMLVATSCVSIALADVSWRYLESPLMQMRPHLRGAGREPDGGRASNLAVSS